MRYLPDPKKGGGTEDGMSARNYLHLHHREKGPHHRQRLAAVIVRDVDEKRDFGYRMWVGDRCCTTRSRPESPLIMSVCSPTGLGSFPFTRACHPIGLVNACNPEAAAQDALKVGMLYQPAFSTGLPTAAAYVAGLAEAYQTERDQRQLVEVVRCQFDEAVRRNRRMPEDRAKYKDAFEMRADECPLCRTAWRFRRGTAGQGLVHFLRHGRRCAPDDHRWRELRTGYRLRYGHCIRVFRGAERHGQHSAGVDRQVDQCREGRTAHRLASFVPGNCRWPVCRSPGKRWRNLTASLPTSRRPSGPVVRSYTKCCSTSPGGCCCWCRLSSSSR